MKKLIYIALALLFVYSCASTQGEKKLSATSSLNDTVRIANDSLEYEIIIIDPGYSSFLASTARPEGYYSQSYLENKNRFLVTDWNQRVQQPLEVQPQSL